MAQYLVRKGKLNYELAKFDDSADVLKVYTMYSRGCSCPSRARSCKHSKILTAWEKANKQPGLVFDDDANIIGNLFA
jgi:hypothetical protein